MDEGLSKTERKRHQAAWRAALEVFQPPVAMIDLVERIHFAVGARLLTDAGYTFFKEAFVAARFAQERGAERVRLIPEERPDFEIELNGEFFQFEVTEADDPERKRTEEYKAVLPQLEAGETVTEDDPQENSERRIALIPSALERAATRKANKGYRAGCGLVIYLNLSGLGSQNERALGWLAPSTEVAKDGFTEVWVLWSGKLFLTWRNGSRTPIADRWGLE